MKDTNIAISKSSISDIFDRFGLLSPNAILPVASGIVNHTLCVDDKYIVRFNIRDPEIRKFKREQIAFELLKYAGKPVPKVLGLDETKQIVPYDVLVTDKLSGSDISSFWTSCTVKQKEALGIQAGKLLAGIHDVSLPYFGSIEDSAQRFSNWPDCVSSNLEHYWKQSFDAGVFERSVYEQIIDAYTKVEPLLENVSQGCLVHGDYHFGNIIGTPDGISGIVDFEWCLAGDPAMDFKNQTNIQQSAPGSDAYLFAGYASVRESPFQNDLKKHFYVLLSKLELSSVSARFWLGKVEWGERNHKRILDSFYSSLKYILK